MGSLTKIGRRFDSIYRRGCVACRKNFVFSQCHIHHLNLGGYAGQRRRGDLFTIGLCPWHHVGERPDGWTVTDMKKAYGPSLKLHARSFRLNFGKDDELLAYQNELISETSVTLEIV